MNNRRSQPLSSSSGSSYYGRKATAASDDAVSLCSVKTDGFRGSRAYDVRVPLSGTEFNPDNNPLRGSVVTVSHQKPLQRNTVRSSARRPKDLLAEERNKFRVLLGYFGHYILNLYGLSSHEFLSVLMEEDPDWPSELLHLKSRLQEYANPSSPVFTPLDVDECSQESGPSVPDEHKILSLMHLYYVYFQEIFISLFIASSAMESGCLDVAGKLEPVPVSTDVHSIYRTTSGLSCSSSECSECVVMEIGSNSSGNSIGSTNESKEYVFGRIFEQFFGAIPSQGCMGILVNSCETEGVLSRKIFLAKRLLCLSPSGISELSPICDSVSRILSAFRQDKMAGLLTTPQSFDSLCSSVVKLVAADIEKILWNLEIGLFSADVSTPEGKSDVIRHFVSSICNMSNADKCLMNYVSKENTKPKSGACSRIFSSLNVDYVSNMGKISSALNSRSATDSDSVGGFTEEDDQTLDLTISNIPRKFIEDPKHSNVSSSYCIPQKKWSSTKSESECCNTFYAHNDPRSWSKFPTTLK